MVRTVLVLSLLGGVLAGALWVVTQIEAQQTQVEASFEELAETRRTRPRNYGLPAAREPRAGEPGAEPLTPPAALVSTTTRFVSGVLRTQEGEPLTAFRVRARLIDQSDGADPETPLEERAQAFHRSDGTFLFDDLADGLWSLTFKAPGYVAESLGVTMPDQVEGLDVRLTLGAVLRGRVVQDAGEEPVPARLRVATQTQGIRHLDVRDDGTFEVRGVAAGKVALVAAAEGLIDSEPVLLEVKASEVLEGVDIPLSVGGRVAGVLLTTIPRREGRRVIASRVDRYEFIPTECDLEGKFEYTLAPGRYRILLDWRGDDDWVTAYADRFEEVVEVVAGETTRIVLGKRSRLAVELSGVVTDQDGPVDSTLVYVFTESDPQPVTVARTDESGRYAVTLPTPGLYRFTVGASRRDQVAFLEEVPGSERHVLDLGLPRGTLAGSVLGPDGVGAAGLEVMLVVYSAPSGSRAPADVRSTETDAEGRYRFDHVRGGSYRLRIGGVGEPPETVPLGVRVLEGIEIDEQEGLEGFDVRLEPAATITGRVSDPSGEALPGVSIRVLDETGHDTFLWANVTTDPQGAFRMPGVGAGRVRVIASTGDASTDRTVEVAPGEALEVELVL
jgi:hypothetical protein